MGIRTLVARCPLLLSAMTGNRLHHKTAVNSQQRFELFRLISRSYEDSVRQDLYPVMASRWNFASKAYPALMMMNDDCIVAFFTYFISVSGQFWEREEKEIRFKQAQTLT